MQNSRGQKPRVSSINTVPPEVLALITSRLAHKNKVRLAVASRHMHKTMNLEPMNPLPTLQNVQESQPSGRDVARCADLVEKLYAWLKTLATPFAEATKTRHTWRSRYKFVRDHCLAHSGLPKSKLKFVFYDDDSYATPLNSIALPIITEENHNWTGDDPSPQMDIVCRVDSTRVILINLHLEGSKVEMGSVMFGGKGAEVRNDIYLDNFSVNRLQPMHFWMGSEVTIEADAPQGIRGIRLALADVLLWVGALNAAFQSFVGNTPVHFATTHVPRELRRIFRAAGLLVGP